MGHQQWRSLQNKIINITVLSMVFISAYLIFSFLPFTNPTNPITHSVYHPDEGVWIAAGKYAFQKSFVERDWHPETWQNQPFGSFGRSTPPVGKYLIGASLFWSGVVNSTTNVPGYDPEGEFVWKDVVSKRPPPEFLIVVHHLMKWLGIVAAIAFWGLAKNLTSSSLISSCATLFFILSPLVIRNTQRAMMEIPLLLFTLLALFLASKLLLNLYKKELRHVFVAAAWVGFIGGLAISTKLNALLMLASIIFWSVSWYLFYAVSQKERTRNRFESLMRMIIVLVIVFVLAGAVFFASNPFLYQNSLRNAGQIFALGRQVAAYQVPISHQLETWGERVYIFFFNGLNISGVFGYWLNFPHADYLLVVAGMVTCITCCLKPGIASIRRMQSVWIIGWLFLTGAGIIIWTPFNWIRWYVPMEPCWALLEGIGLTILLKPFGKFSAIRYFVVSLCWE